MTAIYADLLLFAMRAKIKGRQRHGWNHDAGWNTINLCERLTMSCHYPRPYQGQNLPCFCSGLDS